MRYFDTPRLFGEGIGRSQLPRILDILVREMGRVVPDAEQQHTALVSALQARG